MTENKDVEMQRIESAKTKLNEELIAWVADEDNCLYLYEHYYFCWFCHGGAMNVHEKKVIHRHDCFYLRAHAIQEAVK